MIESRFLRACLLQLLDEQPSHGYEVLVRLQTSGWMGVESGRVYRALRTMESEGLLRSKWADSAHGPRRRAYRLTPAGRKALAALVGEARDARSTLSAFLARSAAASADPAALERILVASTVAPEGQR